MGPSPCPPSSSSILSSSSPTILLSLPSAWKDPVHLQILATVVMVSCSLSVPPLLIILISPSQSLPPSTTRLFSASILPPPLISSSSRMGSIGAIFRWTFHLPPSSLQVPIVAFPLLFLSSCLTSRYFPFSSSSVPPILLMFSLRSLASPFNPLFCSSIIFTNSSTLLVPLFPA